MALFPQQFHANDLVWYNIPLWTNQDFMVKAVIIGTPTKYYQGEYIIELEDAIIRLHLEYVGLEDKYYELIEMQKRPQELKKIISGYDYPFKVVDLEVVKSIFSNLVVVDPENFVFIINVTNKKLTPEDMKKAATANPMLKGICISKQNSIKNIYWQVVSV